MNTIQEKIKTENIKKLVDVKEISGIELINHIQSKAVKKS